MSSIKESQNAAVCFANSDRLNIVYTIKYFSRQFDMFILQIVIQHHHLRWEFQIFESNS